jgi:hypothetical protein
MWTWVDNLYVTVFMFIELFGIMIPIMWWDEKRQMAKMRAKEAK